MYGHQRDFGFKFDDISKRINSLKREIKADDIIYLGWSDKDSFEQAFIQRKKKLKDFNTQISKHILNPSCQQEPK